jgi:glycosyltransferase involved in cell wall biosynthesis
MISVIVPTYNAEKTIKKCLDSIMAQKCRHEVIVVDGQSKDGTREVVRKFKVKLLTDKGGKIATARNVGLKAAKGDFIAFVDSDVILPPKWCEKALKLLKRDKKIAGVGGPGRSSDRGLVSQALNSLLMGAEYPKEEKYLSSVATMDIVYKKSALHGMSFDESLKTGEDPDFNFRLIGKGYRLLYSPDLWVWHEHPTTLGGIVKKWFNYGTNFPSLYSKRKEMKNSGYYVKVSYMPLFFAFLLLSLLNLNFLVLAGLQILLLFLAYIKKGLEIGVDIRVLPFAAIHTVKQLAQLLGILVGFLKPREK